MSELNHPVRLRPSEIDIKFQLWKRLMDNLKLSKALGGTYKRSEVRYVKWPLRVKTLSSSTQHIRTLKTIINVERKAHEWKEQLKDFETECFFIRRGNFLSIVQAPNVLSITLLEHIGSNEGPLTRERRKLGLTEPCRNKNWVNYKRFAQVFHSEETIAEAFLCLHINCSWATRPWVNRKTRWKWIDHWETWVSFFP